MDQIELEWAGVLDDAGYNVPTLPLDLTEDPILEDEVAAPVSRIFSELTADAISHGLHPDIPFALCSTWLCQQVLTVSSG